MTFSTLNNTGYTSHSYDAIKDTIFDIANYLPHTPAKAFGVNFSSTKNLSDTSNLWQNRIQTCILGLSDTSQIKDQSFSYSFPVNKALLNLKISSTPNSNEAKFDFNFHHDVEDLADIKGILGDSFPSDYKEKSTEFVDSILTAAEGGAYANN